MVPAHVGPRPVYDSDVVYIIFYIFESFIVNDNYADQRDIDFIYLGGSWTGNSYRPYCREVKFSWRRKQLLEGKNKKN